MRAAVVLPVCLLACAPAVEPGTVRIVAGDSGADEAGDTAADTAGGEDSGDDSGDTAEIPAHAIRAPSWLAVADTFTVPPERGLLWERDADFRLEDYSVPHVYVRADGTYVMLVTNMNDYEGRYALTSADGIDWVEEDAPLFLPSDFGGTCGNRLPDAAMLYRPDGSFRLLVEGLSLDEESREEVWRVFCQADSTDGQTFTPLETVLFTGHGDDVAPSVPSYLLREDGSAFLYYVAAAQEIEGSHGGIRLLEVEDDAETVNVISDANMLDDYDIDPYPVYLEGGGMRLYHTHGTAGGPGWADSWDGLSFEEDTQIFDNEEGEYILDPLVLRLPDDRLVMYFTWVEEDGLERDVKIGRAFAVD